jgi:hypothetical protein
MVEGKPISVPVAIAGEIVGIAMVGPEGEILIQIDSNPRSKEIRRFLTQGLYLGLTIAPNNTLGARNIRR